MVIINRFKLAYKQAYCLYLFLFIHFFLTLVSEGRQYKDKGGVLLKLKQGSNVVWSLLKKIKF